MLTSVSSKLTTGPVEYFRARLEYELSPDGLKKLLDNPPNNICIVDVRDPAQYGAGHIPTARCIPLGVIVSAFAALPKDKMIVTYCEDIAGSRSLQAALELAQVGFPVQRLIGGFAEWSRRGYPVETAPALDPSQAW
jgi:rhodanese-related sulfurtransferase